MKKIFNIGISLLRPFFVLFSSKLILYLIGFSLKVQMHYYEMVNDISLSFISGMLCVFYVLIFNSMVITFKSEDRYVQGKFVEKLKTSKKFSNFKFVLSTPYFYIDALILLLVPFVFRSAFSFNFITKTFFSDIEPIPLETKRNVMLFIVPLLLIVDFLAHVIVSKNWLWGINGVMEDLEDERLSISFKTILSVLKIAFVYLIGLAIVIMFLPFVFAWQDATNGRAIWVFIFVSLTAFILVLSAFYVRALLKRRSFISRLEKYCKNNSLDLSEISNPYSSIFKDKNGFNFTVEKNGKKYDCKFLYSLFKGSPLIFSDKGYGIKHTLITIRGVQLFSKKTDFTYTFESENKKILIILPIPKKIFASIRGAKLSEADTGERLGEYIIHSSTSFLNSLERDCL